MPKRARARVRARRAGRQSARGRWARLSFALDLALVLAACQNTSSRPAMDLVISGCLENASNASAYASIVRPHRTFIYANACSQSVGCNAASSALRKLSAVTCVERPNTGREFGGMVEFALAHQRDARLSRRIAFVASTIHRYSRADSIRSLILDPRPACDRMPAISARSLAEEYSRGESPSDWAYAGQPLNASGRYATLGDFVRRTLTSGVDPHAPNCRRGVFTTTREALGRRGAEEYSRIISELDYLMPIAAHWMESAALAVFAHNENLTEHFYFHGHIKKKLSREDEADREARWATAKRLAG